MKKYIHLAGCLLSSILFHVNATQQELPNYEPGTNAVQAQDADKVMAELSALTHDGNPAATRRLCGSRNCGSANCSCTPKNNCCTKLQCRRIISTLDVVESKVCLLTECEPIPLSPDDVVSGTLTINQSGSYCLCCDTTANITISASQVTLDLNRHQVTGVLSVSSQEDVFVTNGVITAVSLASCGNTHLSDLAVSAGIRAQNCTNLFISNLLSEGNTGGAGLFISGSTGVFISDSVFQNNEQGIRLNTQTPSTSSNVVVTNCNASGNVREGFIVYHFSEGIYFYNCTAFQNSGDGFAFSTEVTLDESVELNAFDCVSEDNGGHGFNLNNALGTVYLERCLAQNNTANGFRAIAGNTGTINQCSALRNANGFVDAIGSSIKYISNYAQDNVGSDYFPAAGVPFNPFLATTAGISFWYNTFS